jgi:hypothetical protein
VANSAYFQIFRISTAFLEVATASGIDDGQHIPMATAAHTTRYDLQADMVADIMGAPLLHIVLTMTAAHTNIIQN